MTPREASIKLDNLGLSTEKAPKAAIKRAVTRWRSLTIKDEKTHGLVRTILGKYGVSQWPPMVNKLKTIKLGLRYIGGLKLSGLSALQEGGGRTKAHKIKGAFGHKGTVVHPGGPVPPYPSASNMVPAVEAYLGEQLDKEVTRAIAKAGLDK